MTIAAKNHKRHKIAKAPSVPGPAMFDPGRGGSGFAGDPSQWKDALAGNTNAKARKGENAKAKTNGTLAPSAPLRGQDRPVGARQTVRCEMIDPNPWQPRRDFSPEDLAGLAEELAGKERQEVSRKGAKTQRTKSHA